MNREWKTETLAVQAGWEPKNGEPRVPTLAQSTTYRYETAEEMARLFDLEAPGYIYSRINNPTVTNLEEKMTALEGGAAALAFASGQAAITASILNIAGQGDHIVASGQLYGGTVTLFRNTLANFGIDVTFVDPEGEREEILAAFRDTTRCLYGETIGNPGLSVLDFEKFSSIAREKKVPLIIDNTFPTPHLCRPLELGADIVLYSASKYIDGHARAVGGVLVEGGTFDWNAGHFPGLTEPDPTYHGLVFAEAFGPAAFTARARTRILRDLGASMSPFNAWITMMGLETLHLRMERHSENALALATWLQGHPEVSWVNYPGLESHPQYDRAQKYLPRGASGVLTFGLRGGYDAGLRFMNRVELAALVVHVSDTRTSILHPASTTHRQLSPEEQLAAGVGPDMMRVSVGIENIDDIINDFNRALS
jgi:O-acetylhomoserine (thiol)-lyase